MSEITPRDIVAVIIIAGFIGLKILNIETNFDAVIMLILGYYFAHREHGNKFEKENKSE